MSAGSCYSVHRFQLATMRVLQAFFSPLRSSFSFSSYHAVFNCLSYKFCSKSLSTPPSILPFGCVPIGTTDFVAQVCVSLALLLKLKLLCRCGGVRWSVNRPVWSAGAPGHLDNSRLDKRYSCGDQG